MSGHQSCAGRHPREGTIFHHAGSFFSRRRATDVPSRSRTAHTHTHTHTPDDAVSLGLIARRMSRKSPPTSEIDIKPQATPSRRRPQRRACEGAALVKSRPAPRAVGTGSPRPLCSAPRGRSAKQRVSGRSLARGGGARVPVEPVLRLARGDRATRNRIRGEPAWAGLVWFERWAARGE